MTTNQHSWFIEPYYSVLYNDGKLTVLSSSPRKIGQAMAQSQDDRGYWRTSLNGTPIHIHSIIAQHFLGTRPHKFTVNHKDGVKTNNRIENLEYISNAENVRHAFAMGLSKARCGIEASGYIDGRWARADYRKAYRKAYRLANRDKILAQDKVYALAKKNKTTTVTTNE